MGSAVSGVDYETPPADGWQCGGTFLTYPANASDQTIERSVMGFARLVVNRQSVEHGPDL